MMLVSSAFQHTESNQDRQNRTVHVINDGEPASAKQNVYCATFSFGGTNRKDSVHKNKPLRTNDLKNQKNLKIIQLTS